MSRKRALSISLGFIGLFAVLRAGEYGIDYLLGDKDGTITTTGLAQILHGSYYVFIIVPLILIVLKLFEFIGEQYAAIARHFPVVSEKTLWTAIIIAAIAMYGIHSVALPLSYGRDASYYLTYYFQYFMPEPVYHGIMFAPPIPSFFWGSVLQFGGTVLAEVVMAVAYAAAMLAVYRIGRLWSRKTALLSVGVLLCYPSYAILYHRVGNTDMLFSLGFLLWCWYVLATMSSPSWMTFAAYGVMLALLAMVRPTGQVFLVIFGIFVLLLPRITFSRRVRLFLITTVSYALLICLWAGHNYLRYDDFTISRTGTMFPFNRLFIFDKIVRPENGPYSRTLAEAVSTDLLPKEPYKSYEITLDQFFLSPYNSRMYADLPGLSDRVWGWDADYNIFNKVALEAIKTHPLDFLKMTFHFCYQGITRPFEAVPLEKSSNAPPASTTSSLNAKGLPIPSEHQAIPRPYMSLWFCSPDMRMSPDPDSFEFKLPVAEQKKLQELHQKMDAAFPKLPEKNSPQLLIALFNRVVLFFPRMFYCMVLSLLGFLCFSTRRQREFVMFWAIALMTVCATYTMAGTYTLEYRVVFDPIFLLGGIVAAKNFLSYGVRLVREPK